MIWKSQYYLHILQAELTDVDFWKNSVLFRIRGLIPNLCEGKGMKSCQEEGTLVSVISVFYMALAKRKLKCIDLHLMSSHLHVFCAFYVWKTLQLFLYHLIKRHCNSLAKPYKQKYR